MNNLPKFVFQKDVSDQLLIDSYSKILSGVIEKLEKEPKNLNQEKIIEEDSKIEKKKDSKIEKKEDSDYSDCEEDIWNDSTIINEFDNSMKNINEKVNCLLNSNKNEKSLIENKNNDKNWKVGDCCQAVYSEDGLLYEAEIISIENQNCLIRFFGYLNEENKSLSSLLPSRGKNAIKEQENLCLEESLDCLNYEEKLDNQERIHENVTKNLNINLTDFKAPLIPPTPNDLPFKPSNSENELLTTMLLSWYMNGYHTGYYMAKKELSLLDKN